MFNADPSTSSFPLSNFIQLLSRASLVNGQSTTTNRCSSKPQNSRHGPVHPPPTTRFDSLSLSRRFYRLRMNKPMSAESCFEFCIGAGMDLFGLVEGVECRCGASRLNKGIWRDEKPRPGGKRQSRPGGTSGTWMRNI